MLVNHFAWWLSRDYDDSWPTVNQMRHRLLVSSTESFSHILSKKESGLKSLFYEKRESLSKRLWETPAVTLIKTRFSVGSSRDTCFGWAFSFFHVLLHCRYNVIFDHHECEPFLGLINTSDSVLEQEFLSSFRRQTESQVLIFNPSFPRTVCLTNDRRCSHKSSEGFTRLPFIAGWTAAVIINSMF